MTPPFGPDLGQIKGGVIRFSGYEKFLDPKNFRQRRLNFAFQIATKGLQKAKISPAAARYCLTNPYKRTPKSQKIACGGLSSLILP